MYIKIPVRFKILCINLTLLKNLRKRTYKTKKNIYIIFVDHKTTQTSKMVAVSRHFTTILCLYPNLASCCCACISNDATKAIVESQ